ncbi:DnaD domain protein [Ruminococcus sp. 5_1_39BFAA]|uniref:DnaD domain protein n=1 Tax=Ruminococcus sp. 5_1_39BFAA TaxID=457412 RepID=UPI003568B3CE
MITLYNTSPSEVTALSNTFIDHYMPRANGEFVKVYIYLLRMLGDNNASFSLEQMADRLLCTEGDILRALKYWEKEQLLKLRCRADGDPEQIALCNPAQTSPAVPQEAVSVSPVISPEASVTAAAPLQPSPTAKNPDPKPAKKTLTPDRVRELKQNEEIVQLLYIAEQYLGKALTPTEIQKILFFYDELKMSVDLIDYLIEYCVGRGHKSMRYIETVAFAWAQDGISTVEMAKDSTSRYGKDYFTILKSMGISNRNPVDSEISIMNVWLKDYGFSMELIQEACTRTVMQTGQPSFQYADKILSGWLKKGVKTLQDINVLDAQHQKRKQERTANRTPAPKTPNRFNNFHQRDYDFDEYEKRLLNQ